MWIRHEAAPPNFGRNFAEYSKENCKGVRGIDLEGVILY